jgi:RNA polymerase sigma factor for flagellar operon FliA
MATPLDDPENKHIFNQFLLEHAPLIHLHVKKLQNEGKIPEGVDVNDLHMEGFHGLVDALHKYDPSIGASFATYAGRRIQGKMLDHLTSLDPVGKQVRTRIKNVASLNKPSSGGEGSSGT